MISLVKHKSNCQIKTKSKHIEYITNKFEQMEPTHTNIEPNLSHKEKNALFDLQRDKNIVIKKADKSNIFVIMDVSFYRDKLVLKDHLLSPNYESCHITVDKKVFQNVGKLMDSHKQCFMEEQ